jgi:glyoxylase-like metal-dependent hydrolase (beta-lactamase superfamily II)
MRKASIAAIIAVTILMGNPCLGAPLRFEKVSDHCYYLQTKGEAGNVFAVVTDDGILLVDPPPEPDLTVAVDALKRLSAKPVRWVAFSSPRSAGSAGARFFAEQGAMLLAGRQLRALSASIMIADAKPAAAPGSSAGAVSFPWLVFDRQIHLFPSNLEIRIAALQHRARTGGDVVVYVPAEKVLFVGGLYEPARYPDIDGVAQGDAAEWIEGLKQVVDSIPVLKPAIPQAKTDPKTAPEKTLEEGIAVVSSRGEASNFQNVKDLLSACQKLRTDISRAIKAGRSCENFLGSSRADTYRSYGNFDSFASELCEAIESAPETEPPGK